MGRSALLGILAFVALLTGVAAVFTCGEGAGARGDRALPSAFQGRGGSDVVAGDGYVVPPRFARPTPEPPPSLGDPALDAIVARIALGADELLALTAVEPAVCRSWEDPPPHCMWMWISPSDLEQRVAIYGRQVHLSLPEVHRWLWGIAREDGFTLVGAWRLPPGAAPGTYVVVLSGTSMMADYFHTYDGVLAFIDLAADDPVRALAFTGPGRELEAWRVTLDPVDDLSPHDPVLQSPP